MAQTPTSASILGVRVDDVTMNEATDRILGWSTEASGTLIVTPNPEFVMTAQHNSSFRAALATAALAVPDGVGLRWAATLLGEPLRNTVPGVDLVDLLAPRAAGLGHRWFLLGGSPGVAHVTAQVLQSRSPGLIIAGTLSGDPGLDHDKVIVEAIKAVAPVHLLLVAFGAPAQELWLARNLGSTGARVGIGVGGAFNFIAGVSRRPPRLVQRIGLGWLYRLMNEPWRWRRQMALPRFAVQVLAVAARRRLGVSKADRGRP